VGRRCRADPCFGARRATGRVLVAGCQIRRSRAEREISVIASRVGRVGEIGVFWPAHQPRRMWCQGLPLLPARPRGCGQAGRDAAVRRLNAAKHACRATIQSRTGTDREGSCRWREWAARCDRLRWTRSAGAGSSGHRGHACSTHGGVRSAVVMARFRCPRLWHGRPELLHGLGHRGTGRAAGDGAPESRFCGRFLPGGDSGTPQPNL